MITRVWLEEGCCGCGACPVTAPVVFVLTATEGCYQSEIRGGARMDGIQGKNHEERSLLTAAAIGHEQDIIDAAAGCPVDVIRFTNA